VELVPVAPLPLLICKLAAGSSVESVTLPVHTPAANVTEVGLTDNVPPCPAALSVAVPL
jgi:hypothetical protein